MDKEIALAVNFGKAPIELQDAAKAADVNQKKLTKALAKLEADKAEVASLEKTQGELEKAFRLKLKEWDPNTVTAAV